MREDLNKSFVLAALLLNGAGGSPIKPFCFALHTALGIVADLIVLLGLFISIWARAALGKQLERESDLKRGARIGSARAVPCGTPTHDLGNCIPSGPS
jgi:hypothetical protein